MPMLDIQKRHAEVFRLRFGDRTDSGAPRKLTDSIRVTSRSRAVVEAFTAVFGGDVAAWDDQFEAYLPITELPVMVLPGQSITQWWETWRGSVCEKRCDGYTEQLSGDACSCPPDIDARLEAKACRPTTRVNLLCPDVAVVGAGSLVSHGMVAAETLPQSIAVAEAALARGIMVPAVLRVVEHKGRKHFIVPQLEIVGVSLNQLVDGEQSRSIRPSPVAGALPSAESHALVDLDWISRFETACYSITPEGFTSQDVASAIVDYATDGRADLPGEVRDGEQSAIREAYLRLRDRALEVVRDDGDVILREAA